MSFKAHLADSEMSFLPPATGDSGYDIMSPEDKIILPGEVVNVKTGLYLEIPHGYVGLIKDRSSLAIKRILVIAGVIDSSYRGEVEVVLVNHGRLPYRILKKHRIAQLLLLPCYSGHVKIVARGQLSKTKRDKGAFGSTGE